VGYFGYEMKYESLAKSESPQQHSSLPDAYLLFVDRMLVIDHQLNDIYVIALMPGTENEDWLQSTIAEIQRLDVLVTPSTVAVNTHSHSPLSIHLRADYETYTGNFECPYGTCINCFCSLQHKSTSVYNKSRWARATSCA
jgi:para-aminobenzoate synthetase